MKTYLQKITYAFPIIFLSVAFVYAQKTYQGVCDASAAIKIDENHILVAEDENDSLLLYSTKAKNNSFITKFDFFEINELKKYEDTKDKENDIEGVAINGNRAFWITSHGRNKDGKHRQDRYKIFALDLNDDYKQKPKWVGRYENLITHLLDENNWDNSDSINTQTVIKDIYDATQLDVKKANGKIKRIDYLKPKQDGLNIEGLAVTPNGKGLLIGLRNPQIGGKALIIHLKNPNDLVTDSNSKAKFGVPILLNLDGLGIRSIAYSSQHKKYFIIGGSSNNKREFKLYSWSGYQDSPVKLVIDLNTQKNVNPEALIIHRDRLQILNDEGSRLIYDEDGKIMMDNKGKPLECKKPETPKDKKTFSDIWIDLNTLKYLKTDSK